MRVSTSIYFLWALLIYLNTGIAGNPIIVISIDGLRPDAIAKAEAPTLLKLIENGTSFDNARTVRPSITLPAHVSMFTGLDPDEHGITWDFYKPSYGPVRHVTALEIATNADLHTAAFIAKSKLLHLNRPNSTTHFEITEKEGSEIVAAFRRYVQQKGIPDLTFLHLPDPDTKGHQFMWMSPFYLNGVRDADNAVAQIVAIAEGTEGGENLILLITADHGGFGFGHLANIDKNNDIPFIAYGAGVAQGLIKHDLVRSYDTAATILSLLNLPQPDHWQGRPVPILAIKTNTTISMSLGKPHTMAMCGMEK